MENVHFSKTEELAEQIHGIYQAEAKRQGDVRHKDSYADLSENVKEFDRVIARLILEREQKLIERIEDGVKQYVARAVKNPDSDNYLYATMIPLNELDKIITLNKDNQEKL